MRIDSYFPRIKNTRRSINYDQDQIAFGDDLQYQYEEPDQYNQGFIHEQFETSRQQSYYRPQPQRDEQQQRFNKRSYECAFESQDEFEYDYEEEEDPFVDAMSTPRTRYTPAPSPSFVRQPAPTTPTWYSRSQQPPTSIPPGCKSITEISPPFQPVFQAYPCFNRVQSECLDVTYRRDVNLVVSAPTGTGKTVIFELAILRLVEKHLKGAPLATRRPGENKAIYMAPLKALCQEKYTEWTRTFSSIGLKCKELTGDTENFDVRSVSDVDIILTTPEKWDSMTRRWRDKDMHSLIHQVGLIMIDEVHLLDEERGSVLEAVVSRMKTMDLPHVRFVALSATIPNIHDIAEWLNVPQEGVKKFGEDYRPCPLQVKVVGFTNTAKNPYLFDRNLNYKLFSIIQENCNGRPTLVFCSTRKGTVQAAQQLVKDAGGAFSRTPEQRTRLNSAVTKTSDKSLQECLLNGIGFHSAGMEYSDRQLVESLFLDGSIMVLCTTTTLAQGVNLPAHLVVIKGTSQYRAGSGYCEYNMLMVRQMIGRAGRPQFDTHGTAVIMTDSVNAKSYDNMLTGQQPVESNLHNNMIEHINAEIVLNTIKNVSVAIQWLKSSFLFVRMKKNPSHYHLPKGMSAQKLEEEMKNVCLRHLDSLAKFELIKFVDEDKFQIQATDLGRSMARYYVQFETVKKFFSLAPSSSLEDVIGILSSSEEFGEHRIRLGEKKILNEINAKMKFKIKGRISTTEQKINCLIQASLGELPFDNFPLRADAQNIFACSPRILKCMTDFAILKKHYSALNNCLILTKCIEQKMWEDTNQATRQLEGIGSVFATSLANAGITSLEALSATDPRKIEAIVGRNPPFGTQVRSLCDAIPRFDLHVQKQKNDDGKIEVVINLKRKNFPTGSARSKHYYYLSAGNKVHQLLFHKHICAEHVDSGTGYSFVVEESYENSECFVSLICEKYVSLDKRTVLKIDEFEHLKPKQVKPNPSDDTTATPTKSPTKKAKSKKAGKEPATPQKKTPEEATLDLLRNKKARQTATTTFASSVSSILVPRASPGSPPQSKLSKYATATPKKYAASSSSRSSTSSPATPSTTPYARKKITPDSSTTLCLPASLQSTPSRRLPENNLLEMVSEYIREECAESPHPFQDFIATPTSASMESPIPPPPPPSSDKSRLRISSNTTTTRIKNPPPPPPPPPPPAKPAMPPQSKPKPQSMASHAVSFKVSVLTHPPKVIAIDDSFDDDGCEKFLLDSWRRSGGDDAGYAALEVDPQEEQQQQQQQQQAQPLLQQPSSSSSSSSKTSVIIDVDDEVDRLLALHPIEQAHPLTRNIEFGNEQQHQESAVISSNDKSSSINSSLDVIHHGSWNDPVIYSFNNAAAAAAYEDDGQEDAVVVDYDECLGDLL